MIRQTLIILTTALILASATAPAVANDDVLTPASVVQNFRQANQALLVIEDAAQALEPDRQARVMPVLALLEEQLGEVAHQLTTADDVTSGAHPVKLNREVYAGINSDIIAVQKDLEHLAAAIGADDYL